jgi:hypothetical protein
MSASKPAPKNTSTKPDSVKSAVAKIVAAKNVVANKPSAADKSEPVKQAGASKHADVKVASIPVRNPSMPQVKNGGVRLSVGGDPVMKKAAPKPIASSISGTPKVGLTKGKEPNEAKVIAPKVEEKKNEIQIQKNGYVTSGGVLVPIPGEDDIESKDGEMQSKKYSSAKPATKQANGPVPRTHDFSFQEDGSIIIHLTELLSALDFIKKRGKTALIVDSEGQADTFFGYHNCVMIDAKKLFVSLKIMKNMSMEQCMEELRKKIVASLRYGQMLVLCLTNSATDFLQQFNDETNFPTQLIFDGVKILQKENYTKLIRNQDLDEHGQFLLRCPESYQFVVTSAFQYEDVVDFLNDSIPLDKCIKVQVKLGEFAEFASTYLK